MRKSVSAEVNYGIRFNEYSELEKFLIQLCGEVHSRLQKIKRKGKCITLKIMVRAKNAPIETAKFMGHGFCDYLNKSITLSNFTDSLEVITKNVLTTMKSLNIPPKELRGIGIQITKLNTPPNDHEMKGMINKKENDIVALFNKVIQKQSANDNNSDNTNNNQKQNTSEEIKNDELIRVSEPIKTKLESPVKINSPQKSLKSPSRNKTQMKKTIGRPPKIKQKETNMKNCNIMNMLKNVASKRPYSATEEIDSDIDQEVLAELPEEIRQEVLRDYSKIRKVSNHKEKITIATSISTATIATTSTTTTKEKENNSSPTKSKIHVDAEFLNILPSQLRREVEKEISLQDEKIIILKNESGNQTSNNDDSNSTNNKSTDTINENDKISDDNIFIQKNCENLIKAWVDSGNIPEDYDIEILSKHACELIEVKNIYDLYDPLVFLKR